MECEKAHLFQFTLKILHSVSKNLCNKNDPLSPRSAVEDSAVYDAHSAEKHDKQKFHLIIRCAEKSLEHFKLLLPYEPCRDVLCSVFDNFFDYFDRRIKEMAYTWPATASPPVCSTRDLLIADSFYSLGYKFTALRNNLLNTVRLYLLQRIESRSYVVNAVMVVYFYKTLVCFFSRSTLFFSNTKRTQLYM